MAPMRVSLPTTIHWFEYRRVDERITLIREPHVDPLLRCNIWYVRGRSRDLLVDTGLGVTSLTPAIAALRSKKDLVVVATHSHRDHVGGLHEFPERLIHAKEANLLSDPPPSSLITETMPADAKRMLTTAGYEIGEYLLTAVPDPDYDLASFHTIPTDATLVVEEGDVVDIGDAAFEVLHLPGHSPGSIGLWEPSEGILFSGDAVYDGPLLDELPGSDIPEYCETMRRLRELRVTVVHGGHDESFGPDHLLHIVDEYLNRRATASGDTATKSARR